MSSQVEIVSQEFVKPSCSTPESLKDHKLSLLEQLQNLAGDYIPIIFLYEEDEFSTTKIDRSHKSQQLKQSLSEVLTKFYPFAGRISGNALVDCNDSGVLYVEAQVHANLSEAIPNGNTRNLQQYLPMESCRIQRRNDDRNNNIPLAVQISFFECGGMAVGVCLAHAVADMHSLVIFMNAWAENCSTGSEMYMQPEFGLAFNHFPPLDMPADDIEVPKEYDPSPAGEKIVIKRFLFNENLLSEMKQLVSSSSGCQDPTRVETVSAFIWKHLIEIIRAKSDDTKQEFIASVAVNLRPRSTPPLPDSSMGKISAVTLALCESLKSTDYYNLVSPLRTAIKTFYHNYLKGEEGRWKYLELLSRYKSGNESCLFSSWCRFPFYKVDYGWGKPLSVCTAPGVKNTVILMDTKSGNGVQAWISMLEDDMAMLPPQFLAFESYDFTK